MSADRIDPINVLICEEVEKHPVLYDWKTYGFNNKGPETEAWSEIARVVNRSTYECKDKWKQLRCSYGKNLQNMAKRARTPPYYMTPYLKFLDPYITTRSQPRKKSEVQKRCTIKEEDLGEVDEEMQKIAKQSPEDWTWQLEAPTVCKVEDPTSLMTVLHVNVNDNEGEREDTLNFCKVSPEEKSTTPTHEMNDPLVYLPSSSDRGLRENNEEDSDPDMAFFRSLMPDLKSMNSLQKRHFRIECINLINEILSPTQ